MRTITSKSGKSKRCVYLLTYSIEMLRYLLETGEVKAEESKEDELGENDENIR